MGGIMQRGPSWLPPDAGFGGVLGGQPQAQPTGLMGLLGRPEVQDFALQLLANSGPHPGKTSFGQIVGQSALGAQQIRQQRQDDALNQQLKQAQIGQLQNGRAGGGPSSVQEYEYAKANGFKGTFEEWTTKAGQTSRPSNVQEWEYFKGLQPDDQKRYLELRRNPNFKVQDVLGAPTVVTGMPGGGVKTIPLSTTQGEIDAAAKRKQAEAQSGAVGAGLGGITAGINTRGSNAKTVLGMVDEASDLIDKSTGSAVGAFGDSTAALFGKSTEGAQAIAKLRVLQSGLMLNMPRMEGPQSDRDVDLYRQAAASIGDPTVPKETRKAALETIRTLQKMYEERAAGGASAPSNSGSPKESAADRAKRLGL